MPPARPRLPQVSLGPVPSSCLLQRRVWVTVQGLPRRRLTSSTQRPQGLQALRQRPVWVQVLDVGAWGRGGVGLPAWAPRLLFWFPFSDCFSSAFPVFIHSQAPLGSWLMRSLYQKGLDLLRLPVRQGL